MKRPAKARPVRTADASKKEYSVGEALRRIRTDRSLSVRTLAGRTGFSPSFVSQVELNQASPSIASLGRLATALGVTLGEFFGDGAANSPPVTRSGKRRPLTSLWSRARIEALTPPKPGWPFESVLISLAAGGLSGKRPHASPAHQFAIVFEGHVRLTLGTAVQDLHRGDAVNIEPETPHRWENPRRVPTRLVIVTSRRTPSRSESS